MKDESGATAIEYGLIAALISIGIIAAATLLGNGLSNLFNGIGTKLANQAAKVKRPTAQSLRCRPCPGGVAMLAPAIRP